MKAIFKTLFLFSAITIIVSSCSNYGKKFKVEGTKGEVYYKGEGVSERDAKKLGDYLKTEGYFDSTNKTVQLLKAKDAGYDLRFVVDEKKLKEATGAEDNFMIIGALISKNVFDDQPVNVYLADDQMKDLKTLPYDKKKAEDLLATDEEKTEPETNTNTTDAAGYDYDTAGGVKFFWKGIPDEEAKTIADYIVKTGAFAGGTSSIFMTKEGDRYVLKFPVQEQYANDASYLADVEKVSKDIKDNVFANNPFSFTITDRQLRAVKSFDY